MIALVTLVSLYTHTPPHSFRTHTHKVTVESSASALQTQKKIRLSLCHQTRGQNSNLREDLEKEPPVVPGDVSGERVSRLEVACLLRERNEYKEKDLSLLEQIR